MVDLRLGVIGFGNRGRLIANAHRPGQGAAVVALYDPSPRAADRIHDQISPDITWDTDIEQFAGRGLDGVFVLSPDYMHHEHARFLLEHDIAVYLEKPMSLTAEDCDDLLRLAKARSGRLYVGHNMRHMAYIRKMKELIDAGTIGTPKAGWCRHFVSTGPDFFFSDWHAERRNVNSLLIQKGAHDIDILHWLMGSYTQRTTAVGDLTVFGDSPERADPDHPIRQWWEDRENFQRRWPPTSVRQLNPVIDVEDVSMMLMTLQNGTFASYQECHFTPDYWRNYTIIGDEGRLENFGNYEDTTTVRVFNRRTDRWDPDAADIYPIRRGEGGHGGADPNIVSEFLRYVREGGATDTSPVAARYAVAAGAAAAQSLRNGSQPVDVAPVPADVVDYFA